MDEGAALPVAEYPQVWEADLAAGYLEERGIPAWVDEAGLDNPYRTAAGGLGLIRVYVPAERTEEARALLVEMRKDLEPLGDEVAEEEKESPRPSPVWVSLVGLLVVVALAVGAVPHELRIPLGLAAGAGFVLWWLVRDGSPPSSGSPEDG